MVKYVQTSSEQRGIGSSSSAPPKLRLNTENTTSEQATGAPLDRQVSQQSDTSANAFDFSAIQPPQKIVNKDSLAKIKRPTKVI